LNDTICALATPTGGALAIIRISGPEAIRMTCSVCPSIKEDTQANTIHYSTIRNTDGGIIDEAMVSIFKAPHSYTGEDSAELTIHGSNYIASQVINRLIGEGCRMAEPGEFTKRAYLAGKLDLSQAEAVADLIASTNKATHQIALSQLRGHFSSALGQLRKQLLHLTTLLELELDFSDHEDLHFADRTELLELAQKTEKHIALLVQSFEVGNAIKNGIPVAIVGKTNVGKSTLLNALLHEDRAIVSDIHGTTRDTIEDTIDIKGVTFRFIDTAGIRQTTDEIERIGIDRTYAAIDKARIVLWLLDAAPTEEETTTITARCESRTLIPVWNKSDLYPLCCNIIAAHTVIPISAKNAQNLDTLETAIFSASGIPTLTNTDVIVTNARHYDALLRAHNSIQLVIDGLHNKISGDLLSEDLRLTLDAISEISGTQITTNEVLENIFRNFCVGK
jgi:tRNA modification GTPase